MRTIKLYEQFVQDLYEDATLLRKLTVKSKLNFGKFANMTIDNLLQHEPEYLRWVYYNSSNIDFMPDVLDALGIIEDFIIKKPGKNPELGLEQRKTIKTVSINGKINMQLYTTKAKAIKAQMKKAKPSEDDELGGVTNFKFGKHVGQHTPGVTPGKYNNAA